MGEGSGSQITHLLKQTELDPNAAAELLPLVYEELRRLALSKMNGLAVGMTLQPTALVHEAYLRVLDLDDPSGENPSWNGRGHFFGAAAQAMRRILVEEYRRKQRLKHGGGRQRESLEDGQLAITTPNDDLVAINEALEELGKQDSRKEQIVNLRYFVGLTVPEVAEAMNISVSTVEREWRFCRRWLFQRLGDED